MKKTLMALSLALFATVAFAQMPKSSRVKQMEAPVYAQVDKQATSFSDAEVKRQESFKGSIFTKASLFTETFSSTPSYGYTVGYTQGNGYQSRANTRWIRVADTTNSALASLSTTLPVTFGAASGGQHGFYSLNGFNSNTPTDGLMVMSMQDQISAWGGHGDAGTFDSWVAFKGVAPASGFVYDVNFYQYYRRFNRDKCYLDYSSDSSTWNSIQINTTVDGSTLGWATQSLPAAVGNYNNLYLRIRWYCDTNLGGAYGYYWMIDDVSLDSAQSNRMVVMRQEYFDGGYHLVPKGMNTTPMTFGTYFRNNGAINQTNVQTNVYNAASSVLATSNILPVVAPDVAQDTMVLIDPMGYLAEHGYWDGSVPDAQGTTGYIPHANVGEDSIFVTFKSDSLTFGVDTIKFNVNYNASDSSSVWGRDNGYLVGQSRWIYSKDPQNCLWTTESTTMGEQGWLLAVSYRTPASVPQGWVIRGVEIVPSTYPGYALAGAKLNPVLLRDSFYTTAQGGSISFKGIVTNASTYTVQASDLSNIVTGYQQYGTYPTIRIKFPSQPTLEANRFYRVGYEMAETGTFVPACDRATYFHPSDSSSTPLPKHAGNRFGLGAYANAIIWDQTCNISWAGNIDKYRTPMIRMIVGPHQNIPDYNVTWNVSPAGYGTVQNDATNEDVTGLTQAFPEGSSIYYAIAGDPDLGSELTALTVNNQPINFNSDPNFIIQQGYWEYDIVDIHENKVCNATFSVGINTADVAKIKLQPNPATSVATMTIEGVNGNVDFSLIDVNGRVINQKVVDANGVKKIDLTGLAKGTYFVRITNANFTKVEKLIVR